MFNKTYKVVNKKRKWNKMNAIKKRPAKRNDNPLVGKLLNLKYRINDAYRDGKDDAYNDTRADKSWVMNLISDVRDNNLTNLCKEDMLKCNEIWRRYAGK